MERRAHGDIPPATILRSGAAVAAEPRTEFELPSLWAEAQAPQPNPGLAFMFPQLRQPEHQVPVSPETVARLRALAAAMAEAPGDDAEQTGDVPAVYTYLGQFIDHDVSKIEALPGFEIANLRSAALNGPMRDPLRQLENQRNGPLDLDSLYGGAPEDPEGSGRLRLGEVTPEGHPIPGKDGFNDLPRNPPSTNPDLDRAAQIGDPRNDENLIVAQLHVAFLRAHNALLAQHGDVARAREALHRLYLEIVFTDYLPRVADIGVLNRVLGEGRAVWKPALPTQVPLEHAGAAFRFGHSMVRARYDYNFNFGINGVQSDGARVPFNLLFTFTALSGQLGGHPSVPENWVINWERMAVTEKSRRIDTFVTPALTDLRDPLGKRLIDGMQILAERNLLRGYMFGLPTGQAIAGEIPGAPVLKGGELLATLPTDALRAAAEPFQDRTPLWFYVLAEAGAHGGKLGVVGSTIVVETLHALAEATGRPVPRGPVTAPSGSLLELLRLSGNL